MTASQLVLAIDLDGTLLADNDQIHPNDIDLIRQGLPFPIILATGRSLSGVRRPLLRNGLLRPESPVPFAQVINNGALTFLPFEQVWRHTLFDPALAAQLAAVSLRHPEATFLFQSERDVFQVGDTPAGRRAIEMYGFAPIPLDLPDAALPHFSKLMCLSEQRPVLDAVAADLSGLPVHGNYSLSNIYEATPLGIDKASGLATLLPALGLEKAFLLAAGDGDNDAGMFALAGCTFAPRHGREHIRALATHVIDAHTHGILGPILDRAADCLARV